MQGRARKSKSSKKKGTKGGTIWEQPSISFFPLNSFQILLLLTFIAYTKAKVEEDKQKEKEVQRELERIPREKWDHEDFFYLEACYGLHKLLPRQVNVLAQDWLVQGNFVLIQSKKSVY